MVQNFVKEGIVTGRLPLPPTAGGGWTAYAVFIRISHGNSSGQSWRNLSHLDPGLSVGF